MGVRRRIGGGTGGHHADARGQNFFPGGISVHLEHALIDVEHLARLGIVDEQGVVDRVEDRREVLPRGAQVGRLGPDAERQDRVDGGQRQDHGQKKQEIEPPLARDLPQQEGGADPFAFDGAVFAGRNPAETALHEIQQIRPVFPDRAVEFARIEHHGLVELVRDAVLVHVEDRGGLVHREDLDFLVFGGLDDGFVAGIFLQRIDAMAGKVPDDRVAGLDADREPFQGSDVADARQRLVGIDRHLDPGVGRGEVVELGAFGCPEHRVEDVGFPFPHELLGLAPFHGLQDDFGARFLFPQRPLVGQNALQVAVRVEEGIRRIIVVERHDQRGAGRLGERQRRSGGEPNATDRAKRAQREATKRWTKGVHGVPGPS